MNLLRKKLIKYWRKIIVKIVKNSIDYIKHINNALSDELNDEVVVAKFASTTKHGAIDGKTQTHEINYYNLDMIISVGYRVKSNRGVLFRKWSWFKW